MNEIDDIFVPLELPDKLARIFTVDFVLNNEKLNSDQKLGYMQGVNDMINFLRTYAIERRT